MPSSLDVPSASRSKIPSATTPPSPGGDEAVAATGVADFRALPVRIGAFEVTAPLAQGGMGMVYLAHDLRLNRPVALKMLRGGAKPTELARLRAEAEAVAMLRHPNIVQIFEVGEEAGLPFLVLEYINGGSLHERLGGQPIPPREAARLLLLVTRAMGRAHEMGIIHRDLKPGNILLQQESGTGTRPPLHQVTPKVTDFGLAKVPGHPAQTQSGVLLGTLAYMAPEQAAGQTELYSPATDVHALGVILYEMLTGRPPYKGMEPMALLDRIRWDEPMAPSRCREGVPRDLEVICLKCLRKSASERYGDANALAEDLQHFLDGEPILARPVGTVEAVGKWVRRNPAKAALVGVSLVASLAFMVACTVTWRSATLTEYNARLKEALREAQEQRHRAESAEFLNLAENHLDAFQKSLNGNLEIAFSLSAYVQSLPEVSPGAFRVFAQSALARHDDLLALEWLPRVTAQQRPAFEAMAHREGFTHYQILEPEGQQDRFRPAVGKPDYFPVFYRVPPATPQTVLGVDHISLPDRRVAIQRACDTGQPTLTTATAVPVDQAERGGVRACVVYVPVYATGNQPQNVTERRQYLRGYAAISLDMRQMLRDAWKTVDRHHEIDVLVVDTTGGGQEVIYWERAGRPPNEPLPSRLREAMLARRQHWEQSFTVLGQTWRILCAAGPE